MKNGANCCFNALGQGLSWAVMIFGVRRYFVAYGIAAMSEIENLVLD
jgi:hypothetical protein